ncbi:hypothetical protein [Plantibacter sp. YIM 135347]|uniref:hypothetical protein n=1 Tax=Plantibacter sp. YIM 135347 TaxID=3423919 RepID=UPI003D32DFE5
MDRASVLGAHVRGPDGSSAASLASIASVNADMRRLLPLMVSDSSDDIAPMTSGSVSIWSEWVPRAARG